uniref:Uncharacterized protein n=1 Tax=Alexandrium monilatum TaxID=311494 RepID=A0A7S4Q7T2_9DINO
MVCSCRKIYSMPNSGTAQATRDLDVAGSLQLPCAPIPRGIQLGRPAGLLIVVHARHHHEVEAPGAPEQEPEARRAKHAQSSRCVIVAEATAYKITANKRVTLIALVLPVACSHTSFCALATSSLLSRRS